MKKFLSIIFILIFSFSGFSQKSKTQKHKKVVKKVQQIPIIGAPDNYDNSPMIVEESKVIDTLRIKAGKPCVILFKVYEYPTTSYNDHSEENELIQNFGKDVLQIINISQHTYVIFENNQTLDVSNTENSYQGFAYWGGNLEDKVQVKEGTFYATEFVAEQMNVDKESSYAVNNRKYKEEVAKLEKADSITERSKEVMNVYLKKLITPLSDDEGENMSLCEQRFTNLKSIVTYFPEKNGKKLLFKKIVFNKDQQPISIKMYNDKGDEDSTNSFVYENGMLIKIINGDSPTIVKYDDDKMIFSVNVGDGNDTRLAWLNNGILLEKSYVLMIDDKYQHMNYFAEEKWEDNCVTRYINNRVWTINCSSKIGSFPFVHKYTSFQDGDEVLQYRKSKLEKKGDKVFEKYYSDAERESEKDNFKLWGTFQLNDQNLLSSYSFTKDGVKRNIKIEYTYFSEN